MKWLVFQERVMQRQVEQIVNMPFPQIMEDLVEVVKIISQERVSHWIVEQIDVSVPQVVDEIVEVRWLVPQERIVQRQVEQFVNVPVPQIFEEPVEVPKFVCKSASARGLLS